MKRIISKALILTIVISTIFFASACGKADSLGKTTVSGRSIQVQEVSGTVCVNRDSENIPASVGQNLVSGDGVKVDAKSTLDMLIDSDKLIRASENTKFSVVANGDEHKGQVKINLEAGETLISIDNRLENESTFEVETENATMAVRGTVFKVNHTKGENGQTTLEVLEGVVHVETTAGDSRDVSAGETVLVDNTGFNDEVIELTKKILPFFDEALYELSGRAVYDYSAEELKDYYSGKSDEHFNYYEGKEGLSITNRVIANGDFIKVFNADAHKRTDNKIEYRVTYDNIFTSKKMPDDEAGLLGIVNLSKDMGITTVDGMIDYLGIDVGDFLTNGKYNVTRNLGAGAGSVQIMRGDGTSEENKSYDFILQRADDSGLKRIRFRYDYNINATYPLYVEIEMLYDSFGG